MSEIILATKLTYGVQVRYPHNIKLIEEDMSLAIKDMEKVTDFLMPKFSGV